MKLLFSIIIMAFILNGCNPKGKEKTSWFKLKSEDFETTINGKKTGLYLLKNSTGMEAAITNYGGRIVGLTAPGRDGEMADVILGFNSMDGYLGANEVFHGALIGRVGNRVANGKFILDDVEYKLPLNNGPNQLHGGPDGFHNQVWDVIKVSANSIVLHYLSEDGEMGYPGNVNVEVAYQLTDKNELILNYKATTDKTTVVNLTSHPFFNLAGEGNGTINNHILKINAEKYTPVDSTLIPLGENMQVEGTPFDFREGKEIGRDLDQQSTNAQLQYGMGYDHNFVLNQPADGEMFWAATITDPESGRSMEIYTEEPGLQFYGGNFMDGSDTGNSGKTYKFRESFALETQHFPDSPNQPDFPSIELNPGETYSTKTIYKFTVSRSSNEEIKKRWTEEQAAAWGKNNPWLRGANFNPSTAINQLETWQAESFDPITIDKELGWAEEIGLNCMRVYLHHVAWEVDREGFKKRMDEYLEIAESHGIKTIFVFFDDCWNATYQAGKQPDPKPGVHNSGWVRDPGDLLFENPPLVDLLELYVKDVLSTFKNDTRIVMWDLYNEPGNSKYMNKSLPLLEKIFEWGWEIRPQQPLSVGVWNPRLTDLNKYQLANSDIISYHNYNGPEEHQSVIDSLRAYNRPLVCTEYMARRYNSLFENIMPILKKENVGAINWGLVDGKSNTKYAWDEPIPDGSEPELWFCEIFRKDGTPYKQSELDLIKELTGIKK